MTTAAKLPIVRSALLSAALATSVLATSRDYTGPAAGNWNSSSNWSPALVPVNGDEAHIEVNSDTTVTFDGNYSAPGLARLFINGSSFSNAILSQSSNTIIFSGQEQIGTTNGGRGDYIQTGGTHTGVWLILGQTSGSSGTYELGNVATLNMNNPVGSTIEVGSFGNGVFIQTGGTNNVSTLQVGASWVGGSGSYSISNGVVNAGIIYVGNPGNGFFQQTGGDVNVSVALDTRAGGSYILSGGKLALSSFGLTNDSSFSQTGGSFSGPITNNGTLNLSGGGLIVNGSGFTNNSVFNISGGTVNLTSSCTNNGQIIFFNTPTIAGASTFNNLGILTQGSGTLIINAPGNNSGNINLAAAGGLALNGSAFNNLGSINLGTGRISGSASLINKSGGTITGAGVISSGFDNQGGRLLLTNGTTLVTSNFNSSGIIQLTDDAASLNGGVINNTGQILGHGLVGNNINNSGEVEASDGTLFLTGTVANLAIGSFGCPESGKLSLAMSSNAGLINLTGGSFDDSSVLANTGQISGFGKIRTAGLTNNGSVTLTGGFTTVIGNVVNSPGKTIKIAHNPALFTGNVTNNGIFKTTSTTVTFSGTYTELGTFLSDPSDNYFFDVFLNSPGAWSGGVGDRFFVKGTLDWSGGSMNGNGAQTFNQGSATLHDANTKTLNGWTFNNEKPLTLSGGNIDMGNGAVINNTNTFDIQSDSGITNTLGGSATFANANVLRKSAGAATSNIAALLTNTNGNIDVQSGTLALNGGLNIAAATTLQKLGSATLRVGGPQNHGAGANLNILSGNVRLASNAGVAATGANSAVHNLNINVTGNTTSLILESSGELANLTLPFANAGTQGLDLNTPAAAGAFNALRIYAPDLTAAKTTLWSAVKNANGPGSLTPTDGVFDSGKSAHANTGIGLARISDAHGDLHIQIRLARIGDLNLDGQVSISDFIDLAANFNSSGPSVTWQEGDLNYDGSVTISDFIDLAANFNSTYSAQDTQMLANFSLSQGVDANVIGSAVPEPGTIVGLALTTTLLLPRRRARRF